MAYTYSDWRSQSGTANQIARLKLHMREVSDQIGREVGSGSRNVSSHAVQNYLNALREDLADLERRPDATGAVNGGLSYASFSRPPDES